MCLHKLYDELNPETSYLHISKSLKCLFAGAVRVFEAVDSDPMLVQTIDAQSPVSRLLQLKVGAQVGVLSPSG